MTSEPMSDERLVQIKNEFLSHGDCNCWECQMTCECLAEIDRLRAREQELLGRLFSSSENPKQVEADAALGRAVHNCVVHGTEPLGIFPVTEYPGCGLRVKSRGFNRAMVCVAKWEGDPPILVIARLGDGEEVGADA